MKKRWLLVFCLLFVTKVQAGEVADWAKGIVENTKTAWNDGGYDAYVPFYAWHNRLAYDEEHLKKYNEISTGFGLGKSFYDKNNNWHGIYAFGFKDSNYHLETVAGYGYQKNWAIDDHGNWLAGIGYTIGMTQRHEYKYIPVPMPLPIAGIGHKNLMLQAAYVPGLHNFGNVVLFWARAHF